MTDFVLLQSIIKESGMSMVAIARKANIPRPTLYNRLRGIGEFSAEEITGLCKALNLGKNDRERIFFANKRAKMATQTI